MLDINFKKSPAGVSLLGLDVRHLLRGEENTYSLVTFLETFRDKLAKLPRRNATSAEYASKAFPLGQYAYAPDRVEVWHISAEGDKLRLIATVTWRANKNAFSGLF